MAHQAGGTGARVPGTNPGHLMARVCSHPWVRLVFLSENLWPALPSNTAARTLLGGGPDSVATWGIVHPTMNLQLAVATLGRGFSVFKSRFLKGPKSRFGCEIS